MFDFKPEETASGHMYCSKTCSGEFNAAKSSRVMAETNRKYASARMVTNNPMSRPESVKKMKKTLKLLGHKPPVRKGNGTGLTPAEDVLSKATGLLPYVVNTQGGRAAGYPTHYKLDLADPSRLLAIEVDGRSHTALARQEQDRRKEEFLKKLGWIVLRFTNKQVLEETDKCVDRINKGE